MGTGPIQIPTSLISALKSARRVTVLTGAGISAESGVPTFRDAATGVWVKYSPEELATPDAFRRNPRLVWEWYAWRRELVASVDPNPGHLALAELEQRLETFNLITQNVDGLHQRAGSRKVIELHGNLQRVKCCEDGIVVPLPEVQALSASGEIPPHCPRCGGLLRPDVVWFGEILPPQNLEMARRAASACDIFLSVGTSGIVEPAASLPRVALQSGAIVVEVNLAETPLSRHATYVLKGPAGVILPALISDI
jgi:NAD-dependent deacetylase